MFIYLFVCIYWNEMEEIDDYMSPIFTQSLEELSIQSTSTNQSSHNNNNQKEQKSNRQIEREKRHQGLMKPLGCDNVGYRLLYKDKKNVTSTVDSSDTASSSARSTSLSAVDDIVSDSNSGGQIIMNDLLSRVESDGYLCSKRRGLGYSVRSDISDPIPSAMNNPPSSGPPNDNNASVYMERFIKHKRRLFAMKVLKRDLKRSLRIVREFESSHSVDPTNSTSPSSYQYPSFKFSSNSTTTNSNSKDTSNSNTDRDDEDEEYETLKERLDTLTRYLRDKYGYCMYCGVRFDDEWDVEGHLCTGDISLDQ